MVAGAGEPAVGRSSVVVTALHLSCPERCSDTAAARPRAATDSLNNSQRGSVDRTGTPCGPHPDRGGLCSGFAGDVRSIMSVGYPSAATRPDVRAGSRRPQERARRSHGGRTAARRHRLPAQCAGGASQRALAPPDRGPAGRASSSSPAASRVASFAVKPNTARSFDAVLRLGLHRRQRSRPSPSTCPAARRPCGSATPASAVLGRPHARNRRRPAHGRDADARPDDRRVQHARRSGFVVKAEGGGVRLPERPAPGTTRRAGRGLGVPRPAGQRRDRRSTSSASRRWPPRSDVRPRGQAPRLRRRWSGPTRTPSRTSWRAPTASLWLLTGRGGRSGDVTQLARAERAATPARHSTCDRRVRRSTGWRPSSRPPQNAGRHGRVTSSAWRPPTSVRVFDARTARTRASRSTRPADVDRDPAGAARRGASWSSSTAPRTAWYLVHVPLDAAGASVRRRSTDIGARRRAAHARRERGQGLRDSRTAPRATGPGCCCRSIDDGTAAADPRCRHSTRSQATSELDLDGAERDRGRFAGHLQRAGRRQRRRGTSPTAARTPVVVDKHSAVQVTRAATPRSRGRPRTARTSRSRTKQAEAALASRDRRSTTRSTARPSRRSRTSRSSSAVRRASRSVQLQWTYPLLDRRTACRPRTRSR